MPTLDEVLSRCPSTDFGGIFGYRCEATAGFVAAAPRWTVGDPQTTRCLVHSGLPQLRALFDGGAAIELPAALPLMTERWWGEYAQRLDAGLPVSELEQLLASAYDQACRDAAVRSHGACQFPFPALQSKRRLATGEACPPEGAPGSARFLFANGSVQSHVLLPQAFLPLGVPLTAQLDAWVAQGLGQPNIAALVQLGRDQLARCSDAGVDFSAEPNVSQFAGSAWVWRVDDGADRELLAATDFPLARWAGDGGAPVEIQPPVGNAYVLDAGWLIGVGPGATAIARLDGGTISVQWTVAPTAGETSTSPRATLVEHNAEGYGSHAWSWSDQEVRFSIDVRVTEGRTIIPVLWATYSVADGGAEPNYVVYSGRAVVMDGGWQHLENVFRLPGPSPRNAGVPSINVGAGLDMADIVGFQGVLELRRPSLRRVVP